MIWDIIGEYHDGELFHFSLNRKEDAVTLYRKIKESQSAKKITVWLNGELKKGLSCKTES